MVKGWRAFLKGMRVGVSADQETSLAARQKPGVGWLAECVFLGALGLLVVGLAFRASIEGIIQAIKLHASAQNPLLIEVDEGSAGEKVRIYLS